MSATLTSRWLVKKLGQRATKVRIEQIEVELDEDKVTRLILTKFESEKQETSHDD